MTITTEQSLPIPGKGDPLSFDARIVSVTKSEWPKRLTLQLRSDEGTIKATVEATTLGEKTWEKLARINPESLVHVTGHFGPEIIPDGNFMSTEDWKDTAAQRMTGAFDVIDLIIVAHACPDLPLFKRNELDLGQRLNNRILDLRNAGNGAILKLHSGMCQLYP